MCRLSDISENISWEGANMGFLESGSSSKGDLFLEDQTWFCLFLLFLTALGEGCVWDVFF